MSETAALGDGPIAFFTAEGVQIEVPLSAIYFLDGQIKTHRVADARFDAWLAYLAQTNRLVPGDAPPIKTAMVATAVDPGLYGNTIQVTVTQLTATTVDVAVTQTDEYAELKLATLDSTLGTTASPAAGTKPGLLFVTPGGVRIDPVASPATPVAPPAAFPLPVPGAGGVVAFTLEPRRSAPPPSTADFIVSITNIKPASAGVDAQFTLTVTWSHKVTLGNTADMPTELAKLGYLVKFKAPDGGVFTLPQPGTVALNGGREPVAAVAASALLLAKD